MKAAAIQFESTPDSTLNRALIAQAIDTAAATGAVLLVLPEAAQRAFGSFGNELAGGPEDLEGPFVTMLVNQASKHGIHIVAGMFETEGGSGRPFNTSVVAGPGGVVAAYRKIHLYDALGFVESDGITAGSLREHNLVTFVLDGFTIGVMTCFDLRFPEMTRALVDRGADVITLGAAWVPGPRKREQWRTLLEARAIESTAFVIAAAQPGPRYCGGSSIIGPDGSTIAEAAPETHEVITGRIDREVIDSIRMSMPVLAQRRLNGEKR